LKRGRPWYVYVIAAVLLVIVVLFAVFNKQIVHAIQPAANKIHSLPAGWIIPIAIFFVISFPPLFGHEIVAMICGLTWGLGVGFAITAAGTLLGEIGNFYAFRICCRARAEKLEKDNIVYGCLSRICKDGGIKIALIARYSAIPPHFTTAVFSVCGMNIFVFIAAAILSLPKQFITVYIGSVLEDESNGSSSVKKERTITYIVLAITIAVTLFAMRYLRGEMEKVKHEVIYAKRKYRQARLDGNTFYEAPSAENSRTQRYDSRSQSVASPLPPYDPYLQNPVASRPAEPYVNAPSTWRAEDTVQTFGTPRS